MINQEIENARIYLYNFNQILNQMADKMLSAKVVNNITIYFIRCMIPHYEGAIAMCRNLLKYRIDPRLKIVAENIIKEQSEGVKELQEIRKKLC